MVRISLALMSRGGRRQMFRYPSIFKPATVAHAHCDVPCGIYDPHQAEIAARTVARMVELIGQIPAGSNELADRQKFVRCVTIKEQHAEIVKHEVQIIWSDYFKPEHIERYPDLHDRVWKILKLASKNKQNIDAQAAAELEAAVKEFSDIFWSTKK
jgi:nickel superoxide dismutase